MTAGAAWSVTEVGAGVGAVARIAATEALRSRLLVVVTATITLALGALAWGASGDGTPEGHLRAFLSWGSGWIELVLSLTTVFLSVTLAQALRDGRLVVVAAGPLPRGLLPAGWWAGTALALVALVVGAQVLLWGLARAIAHRAPPGAAPAIARILDARGVARPPRVDSSQAVEARVDATLAAMERAGELADRTPEQRDEVRELLLMAEGEATRSVARGRVMEWPVEGIDPAPGARAISLRFRYSARAAAGARQVPGGGPRGVWAIIPPGSPGTQVEGRWASGTTHELPAPLDVLEGSSSVTLWYQNREESPVVVVFPEQGVELLYPAGTFEGNVVRAGAVLLGRLLVVAAVGVAAAALIDGKLAALAALFVLAVGAGRGFLLESLDQFSGFGAASPAVVGLLEGLLWLLPDLASADLAGLLSAGEQVEGAHVLRALALDGVVRAAGLLALVAVPFGRRELGGHPVTRTQRALALLTGVLGLTGQALLRPRLEARQVEAGVVIPSDDQGSLAADMAVPVLALGAFRGLVVDYLWLRSIHFRERGRVYEARQVAEQICRLQPRLPDVWAFLGHDLAYNVAAAVPEGEARWRWILNGIELLRDQGLRYNPGDPDLAFMLARIYQDKVGTTTDDHHMLYKLRHAELMEQALGDTPLAALASAPAFDALAADPATRPLLARLAALGLEDADAIAQAAAADEVAALRADPAWPGVLAAARAQLLRERQRMDPARMLTLDRRYGPLDWRGCDAATVYWADVGLEGALRLERHRDAYALRRTLHAALKNVVRRGRIERFEDGVFLAPQPELVFQVDAYLREAIDEAAAVARDLEPRAALGRLSVREEERLDAAMIFERNQRSAREGFLCEAIVLLAEYGREAEARRAHAIGRRDLPDSGLLQLSYDDFVLRVFAQRFVAAGVYESQTGMAQLLEGTWVSAYTALAMGEDDRYRGLEAMALASQRRWEAFLAGLDEPDARARLGLRYDDLRRRSLRTAAASMPPVLQERLAERLGIEREALLRGDLAPPRAPEEGGR